MSDLTLFDIGDDQLNSSTSSSKEEWSDEDFQETQGYKEGIIIRSKVKRLQMRMKGKVNIFLVLKLVGEYKEDKLLQVLLVSN